MSRLLGLLGPAAALVASCNLVVVPSPTPTPTEVAIPTPSNSPTESPGPATPSATASSSASPTPTAPATASPTRLPSPTPSAPPAAQEGSLTIWSDAPRLAVLNSIGQTYSARTGIEVRVHALEFNELGVRLAELAPHGQGPDIALGAHEWLGSMVEAGVVAPLDPGDARDDIVPVALQAFTYDGQLYGLPVVSESVALVYNTAHVGDQAPVSWSEMKAAADQLQDAAAVARGYCLPSGDPYHSYPILTGMGGYLFGRDEDGDLNTEDVGLDSPGGRRYAQELDLLVKDGLAQDGTAYEECESLMSAGQAAFLMTGPWALPELKRAAVEEGLRYAIAPVPVMDQTPRPMVNVQGLTINAFSPNPEAAVDFLTGQVATDEAMLSLWEADPRLPVWNSVADAMADPAILAFQSGAVVGDPMPAIPGMPGVWEAWKEALDTIFAQAYDPTVPDADAAIVRAAESIRGLDL